MLTMRHFHVDGLTSRTPDLDFALVWRFVNAHRDRARPDAVAVVKHIRSNVNAVLPRSAAYSIS